MKKALTYTSFIVTSLIVVLAFITSTTYLQLGVAILLYPLIAYFAYKMFFVKDVFNNQELNVQQATIIPATISNSQTNRSTTQNEISAVDIDKRAFLKVIGATGISLFMFSLFTRRSGAYLFGDNSGSPGIAAITDSGGNKIDPSERQPLDGYIISEIDDSYISYYGFVNSNGAWYIMKEDPENGTFRYHRGDSGFTDHWKVRDSLSYDYFNVIFEQ